MPVSIPDVQSRPQQPRAHEINRNVTGKKASRPFSSAPQTKLLVGRGGFWYDFPRAPLQLIGVAAVRQGHVVGDFAALIQVDQRIVHRLHLVLLAGLRQRGRNPVRTLRATCGK